MSSRDVRPKVPKDDEQGLLYLWTGYDDVTPFSFDSFGSLAIQKVAIGAKHCLFLTAGGATFAFGRNHHGQLGLGGFRDCNDQPRPILAFQDQVVVDIACGARHSAAVLQSGSLYCWGDSTHGQCGLGTLSKYPDPQAVSITEPVTFSEHTPTSCERLRTENLTVHISSVSCGTRHTAALSDCGEVWTWGSGVELGLNNVEKAPEPQRVEHLVGRRVLRLCCGAHHTIALVQKFKRSAHSLPNTPLSKPAGRHLEKISPSQHANRSGSPIINNIQLHKTRPMTCTECNGDVYKYTETSDSCIIDDDHTCPLGLEVKKHKPKPLQLSESIKTVTSEDVSGLQMCQNITLSQESRCDNVLSNKTDTSVGSACNSNVPGETQSDTGLSTQQSDTSDDRVSLLKSSVSCTGELSQHPVGLSPGKPVSISVQCESESNDTLLTHKEDHTEQTNNEELNGAQQVVDSDTQMCEDNGKQHHSDGIDHVDNVARTENDPVLENEVKGGTTSGAVLMLHDRSAGRLQTRHNFTEESNMCSNLADLSIESAPGEMETSLLTPVSPAHASPRERKLSGGSYRAGIKKSRSTFLDESEAKEFLQKQLYGEDEGKASRLSSGSSPPGSPFVKKIQENFMQYVPTAQAIAMHEYVSNFTKNVVSNIKDSIDRFGMVSGMGGPESMSSFSSQEEYLRSIQGFQLRISGGADEEEYYLARRLGDFARHGSMPRSTSMGIPAQQHKSARIRKNSLPSGLIDDTKAPLIADDMEIILDTEVWSWGDGSSGQLGHGDILNRLQPCVVKPLADKRVVDIAVGSRHSMAIISTGKVMVWGQNENHELGRGDTATLLSPMPLELLSSSCVWGVAAGDRFSIFLLDGAGFCPDIYYTGNQAGKESSSQGIIHRIGIMRKLGWACQLFAGGELCACVMNRNVTGYLATLHEIAASERAFHTQLESVSAMFLKPLLQSESFKTQDSSMFDTGLEVLVEAFYHLSDMVLINHIETVSVIRNQLSMPGLQMLAKADQCVAGFQHYSKCFADMLAMGGFEHCTRKASSFFEHVKGKFTEVLEPRKIETDSIATMFKRILQIPFLRLKDYGKLVSKLALKYPAYTAEHHALTVIAQQWDALKDAATADHNLAEKTKTFWETCNARLADVLRLPGRRLLRESKQYPLSLQSAGRFSTHVFLLFSDIFVHVQYSGHQVYPLSTVWLDTIQNSDSVKNGLVLTTPEDQLTLVAPTASDKAEWLWALNQAIDKLLTAEKNLLRPGVTGGSLAPPRDRHSSHVFTKSQPLKDAKYIGMWKDGKMNGSGELQWPDGRRYVGKFQLGQQEGYGVYTVLREDGEEIHEGYWKQGKMHGFGSIRYANGSIYEGYFHEGRRQGQGLMKQGKITSDLASIYIGEWLADKRQGFGVYDDILKGEKYMGEWQDDARHGAGIIVTLDSMYFEGSFINNKVSGFGLLITEDNSCYEGEFAGGPVLYGKGTLTLPNGDYIEGSFNGTFSEGVKVNGTFHKSADNVTEIKGFTHALGVIPKSFGNLSVGPDRKWSNIFSQCLTTLCCEDVENADTSKAWERVASIVAISRHSAAEAGRDGYVKKEDKSAAIPEDLQRIPAHSTGNLSTEYYHTIKHYLAMAFDTPLHPLGRLLVGLVDVYRATYVGVGAHPRLLHHAVLEATSYITRLYPIVRVLFPDLPPATDTVEIYPAGFTGEELLDEDDEEVKSEVVSAAVLLHPLLLPKIYPPLFTLYALYNEKDDEKYWKRVSHWNKQSDVALMVYLGVNELFWLTEDTVTSPHHQKSTALRRDYSYTEAIESLQHLSTSFSPAEKLQLIQKTFDYVNQVVQTRIGKDYLWCMDDLFPVFLYVVVRARIQHLGAEIHLIDDLMEEHLEHGELGIMFTTLKACYFQIQNEKVF